MLRSALFLLVLAAPRGPIILGPNTNVGGSPPSGPIVAGTPQTTRPIFELDFNKTVPSVANLDPNLTINGTTVTPTFRYKGGDCDATDCDAWDYGDALTRTAVATPPDYNDGSPLLGANDDSVHFNGSDYYQSAAATTGDVTTEDMVVELVAKFDNIAADMWFLDKYVGPAQGWGVRMRNIGTGRLDFLIRDADSGLKIVQSANTLTAGAWYHYLAFVDRSGSVQIYLNGTASGAAVDISAAADTITNNDNLHMGEHQGGASAVTGNIAYAAMWKQDAWLDTHLQATVAAERFARLTGVYAQRNAGNSQVPTTLTRTTTATMRKYTSGVGKLYTVGAGWPRGERLSIGDGLLSEGTEDNIAIQSEDDKR
jgi:hypothetical protein